MKTQALHALISLAVAGSAHAAGAPHDHAHEHKPLHGGVVVELKEVDYELVAKPEIIQLYLREHGQATALAKVTAKVTLLTGTNQQEVALQPAGNHLQATGNFKVGPGTKAVAVVTINGKPAAVRFTLK